MECCLKPIITNRNTMNTLLYKRIIRETRAFVSSFSNQHPPLWGGLGRLLVLSMLLFAACDDKLDIVPKGQSTLETVDDLEMLLNSKIGLGSPMNDLGVICNEDIGMAPTVSTVLTQTNTLDYAYLAYDESVNRANLTQEDDRYTSAYRAINWMNTVIEKAPGAIGSDSKRTQIIAEAHVMRAYLHWLLVNIYAKQYDAQTAATDGGIAYVTSNSVFADNPKLTVQQVYDNILADCADEYIDALPERDHDPLRGDQAWGNAVRAKVLMQMKRYDEALPYAQKSIDINGTIEDRSYIVDAGDWTIERRAEDNLVYFGSMVAPFMECTSVETTNKFEAGDYVLYYAYMFGMKPGTGGDDDDDYGDDDDYSDDDSGDYSDDWDDAKVAAKAKAAFATVRNTTAANAKAAKRTVKVSSHKSQASKLKSQSAKAFADDGFDASGMAWNSLYGMITTGVNGSLMYYAMSSWVNTYGITSDRMYYTAAECYIRTGQIQKGMDLVNQVRQYRIDAAHYEPLTASTEAEAMAKMQDAKWIECLDTYENFFDCKRWNTESAYRRTITRDLGDYGTFSISPDSPLWIFPFPLQATRKNATLTNNY